MYKRYLIIREAYFMTTEKKSRFTVINNEEYVNIAQEEVSKVPQENLDYQSNPIYQRLLNFRNLQEKQKKRFSVDDLFKLC